MIHGLIVGILAGLLAGKFMGRQNDGCIWNFFLGLFGGFIGGWLFDLVGIQWEAGWIGEIGTAVVGAVLLLWIGNKIRK
ncbi:MAG: GlsB/YeaQ/YmgE family stress response membrane protein [Bacteroidaceae bacterium]|jgi:uncharacterized membrane protein YeaQ/YmgE (transglycosylase-associated protein family)|nr:GlsB/YeaQ/YmgE family stress response membrane protein [Bacteroidaceae bacterium]